MYIAAYCSFFFTCYSVRMKTSAEEGMFPHISYVVPETLTDEQKPKEKPAGTAASPDHVYFSSKSQHYYSVIQQKVFAFVLHG